MEIVMVASLLFNVFLSTKCYFDKRLLIEVRSAQIDLRRDYLRQIAD